MKYDKILLDKLKPFIDEDFAKFSRKIMRTDNLLGVRVPILKEIAKEFKEFDDFVYNVSLNSFENVAIVCFYIGQNCKNFAKLKEYIDYILPFINNWGNCDIFVSSIKLLKGKNKLNFLDVIYQYLENEQEFAVRFAIVCLLDYYLINEDLIPKILNKAYRKQGKTYYIDMAIAWLISNAYIKFKDCAQQLLESKVLSKEVQNKSISKICDSLRVLKEDKIYIKTLRM